MLCMQMQRTGNDDRIKISFKHAAMIVEGAHTRNELFRFVARTRIDVGYSYQLRVGYCEQLLKQIVPATAQADHADPHTVVGSKHSGGRSCKQRCTSGRARFLDELTSRIVRHIHPSVWRVYATGRTRLIARLPL